jgi:serine phosphatase RsbU (regulator of sigma subunit)
VLVAAWVFSYLRKKLPFAVDLLAAVALLVVLNGLSDPRQAQGFFFATLMFSGLYGGVFQLIARLVIIEAVFFSQGDTNPLSAIGFTAAGLVNWALGRAIEKQGRLEARFRSLVTNASDMIVVVGEGGKLTWQSPAVKRLLGRELNHGELPIAEDLELLDANGSRRECRALVSDLRGDPNVEGMVLNIRDVTEQNRTAKAAREIEIASQIQTALLPKTMNIAGFELAATMAPAEEIGGDYYDVLATPDGCMIGIGDVSGHGLVSGLVMLMLQSSLATVARERPQATPAELLIAVNALLYDNIHNRLAKHEHVTMTLLKLERSGRVVYAGAHEELIIQRASGKIDLLPTPGTWLGALPDVRSALVDQPAALEPGDTLVLYTDGVVEARNGDGEQFGMERLVSCIEALHGEAPQELVKAVRAEVDAWTSWSKGRDDDLTLLAARFSGGA